MSRIADSLHQAKFRVFFDTRKSFHNGNAVEIHRHGNFVRVAFEPCLPAHFGRCRRNVKFRTNGLFFRGWDFFGSGLCNWCFFCGLRRCLFFLNGLCFSHKFFDSCEFPLGCSVLKCGLQIFKKAFWGRNTKRIKRPTDAFESIIAAYGYSSEPVKIVVFHRFCNVNNSANTRNGDVVLFCDFFNGFPKGKNVRNDCAPGFFAHSLAHSYN